ncbi:MAG: hypothetical protein R3B68_08640 [Phycisphaerales bacterium]
MSVADRAEWNRRRDDASRRLGGCCLLDGGVRPSPLVEEAARSVLDLDIGPDYRMLDHWIGECGGLEWSGGSAWVRVLHGGSMPAPEARASVGVRLDIVADANAYRGPAGVVRDGMFDVDAEADVLVCESARYIGATGDGASVLGGLLRHHWNERADVTIARDATGAPAGVLVVSRWTLDEVPERGFVDLKEQWLRRLVAGGARVLVYDLGIGTHAIRTRLDALQVARDRRGSPAGSSGSDGGRANPAWAARERIRRRVESGWSISRSASVSPSAVVARSIVMERATVGDDAVVSSSVLLPGAVVPSGAIVMDAVVPAGSVFGPRTVMAGAARSVA